MTTFNTSQTISFVCYPADLKTLDINTLQENGVRIIVDLTAELSTACIQDIIVSKHLDIKLTAQQLLKDELLDIFTIDHSVNIWIESFDDHPEFSLEQIKQSIPSSGILNLYIITGDIRVIEKVFEEQTAGIHLALKGSEASGFVSPETALTLLNQIEDLVQSENPARQNEFHLEIHIWGGIFTPEGASVFLFSGVQSVIFESIHWLTDGILTFSENQRRRISSLRIDHSTLIPISSHLCFRAYNKGNSHVVSKINKKAAVSLQKAENIQSIIAEFFKKCRIISEADFNINELIPLGAEASFASRFPERYGSITTKAMLCFVHKIQEHLESAHRAKERLIKGDICNEFGTRYPFIQGGMACISDIPDFALAIAKAGGLPTIALGVQNGDQLEAHFSNLEQRLENHPYGVNIIALAENPHRDDQLDWIREKKPPFVVISAGDPAFGATLQKEGIQVIYVTSDVSLLNVAWKNNISYVVLEGHEAGGHIGSFSTLTLAQAALDLKEVHPEFQAKKLILAGGIFNANSLHRAAILGADAVQMGTVYLATKEITASGALSSQYQEMILQSSHGGTRITGHTTGLLVRSIDSPKIHAIKLLETSMHRDKTPEEDARRRLEEESVGSLFIAARCCSPYDRGKLSEERCLREGQFMSGSVAGSIKRTFSLNDLHTDLAERAFKQVLNHGNSLSHQSKNTSPPKRERIAITGMAMSNSLGNDPDQIWQGCCELKSGITEVPDSRWDHKKYFTDSVCHNGKTYCRVGAFQSIDITRKDLGISPHDFRTLTNSTRLTLWLARQAIEQSNILSSDIPRHRIGVLVSQNSGEIGSTTEDLTLSVISADLAKEIQTALNLDPSICDDIKKVLDKDRIHIDDTTLLGRLNCAAGGFICNEYGFTGPSFSVSAACATGLVALHSAIQLIKTGVLDAAIVGGGEELLHPASFLEFSALGALAGKGKYDLDISSYSSPFDKNRSGMVLGEGGGLIVIERESIARGRNADIFACITGVGASNNHKGMVESVAETQQLAIDASFTDAGYNADQVDMVECHATATQTGDIEEIKALKAIYPRGNQTVLSSFKSQIGHTLGSSGINSLIHGVCALQAKILPPTLNYKTPDPDLDLESWGFRVLPTPHNWPQSSQRPRRFQVNAFGFGGANYVVQLEEVDWSPDGEEEGLSNVAQLQPSEELDVLSGVSFYLSVFAEKEYHIAAVDTLPDDIRSRLRPYQHDPSSLNAPQLRGLARDNIFLKEKSAALPFALVFAGQGSHYFQMGRELYNSFATIRKWMDKVAELADFDILDLMFNSPEENLRKTQWQQPALFVLQYAIYQQLSEFNLHPSALAGHSMGELTALCVAGSFSYKDAFRIINKRAQCMEKAAREAVDPGGMIAVDVPMDILEEMVELDGNLYFTNFNSVHQTVIGGSTHSIERFKEELDNRNYWNHILQVSMAFHSPVMKIIRNELGDYLDDIDIKSPLIPVISNTTRLPYPDNPDEVKKIIIAHLESPVHWQSNVTTLFEDYNCSLFVEIGPQDTLGKLIEDILPETKTICTCSKDAETTTLRQSLAALFTEGILQPTHPPAYLNFDLNEPESRAKPAKSDVNSVDELRIQGIIQREINRFALQGVEKFLKPAILKAIGSELGHSFPQEKLDDYLGIAHTAVLTTQQSLTPSPSSELRAEKTKDFIVEQVIQIIMDATGYERSEIEPEMDIRQDLSIRSSRLPVIMDAAEQVFSIVIRLEDFMDVRTISDFANRVKEVMSREGVQPFEGGKSIGIRGETSIKPDSSGEASSRAIARMVFMEIQLPKPSEKNFLSLKRDDNIVIFTLGCSSQAEDLKTFIAGKYGAPVSIVTISSFSSEFLVSEIGEYKDLSGLILLTDFSSMQELEMAHIPYLCTSLFALTQKFLQSPKRKFCVHLRCDKVCSDIEQAASQGMLGIMLSATLEYQSVLFRSVKTLITPLSDTLNTVLNKDISVIELELREDRLFSPGLIAEEAVVEEKHILSLGAGDTVLITGGAQGLGPFLSRSLAATGCRILLAGRSNIETESRIGNIQSLLTDLEEIGCEAHYFRCDITDSKQVEILALKVQEKFGRLSGIIHGAGILEDSFIPLMSTESFSQVVQVKYSGLFNLIESFDLDDLKFISALSSIAAITGNVGQSNYCCGNRAMATLLETFGRSKVDLLTKTFWLPPIEGAGMADDPDLKEIIKISIGENAFIHVEEISNIIVQELLAGPRKEQNIIPARDLPTLSSVSMAAPSSPVHWFSPATLDMIDKVSLLDWGKDVLITERTLDHNRDLWIKDHRPFSFLKQPIASAIMVVESFLEASYLLCPHLVPRYLQNIHFMKMLECPLGEQTRTFTLCQYNRATVTVHCRHGKGLDVGEHVGPHDIENYFTGEIVYGEPPAELLSDGVLQDIAEKKGSALISGQEMSLCYQERCGLTGRYRVLHSISSFGSDFISGKMLYPKTNDFSPAGADNYHFPLYILEALMQIGNFQTGLYDSSEKRSMVPTVIGSLIYHRNCRAGEEIELKAKKLKSDDEKIIWKAAAYDSRGNVILLACEIEMTWIS